MSEESKRNYRAPRHPTTESEELALYKGLFQLQVIGRRRREAEEAIAQADKDAQSFVDMVKPYASWEEIATALGIHQTVANNRFSKRGSEANDGSK